MIIRMHKFKSLPKTNVISECDFGQLDHLLQGKPNASTLSLEAMVLFSNKTAQWLNKKSQGEVKDLLQKAQSVAPEFKKLYEGEGSKCLRNRLSYSKLKNKHFKQLKRNLLDENEHFTQEIVQCGLWQTRDDIAKGLAIVKSNSAKLKALNPS